MVLSAGPWRARGQLQPSCCWDSCSLGHAESDLWASLFLLFFVVGGIFKDTKMALEQRAVPCDPVRRGGSRMVRNKL